MKDTQQNEESDLHDILGGEKVVIVTKGKKKRRRKRKSSEKKKKIAEPKAKQTWKNDCGSVRKQAKCIWSWQTSRGDG